MEQDKENQKKVVVVHELEYGLHFIETIYVTLHEVIFLAMQHTFGSVLGEGIPRYLFL